MEEKREVPEGVKEEMGACIFCGQTYMFANVGLGTEQLNEAATERCTCEEAKNWQVQRKRAEKVRKKTERIFANDKCLNFMLTSANMILSGGFHACQTCSGFTHADFTIKLGRKYDVPVPQP